ncbi:MAG: CusA/CzcA family heavy metal efflux RND transporter [Pseudomonadota bacterium]
MRAIVESVLRLRTLVIALFGMLLVAGAVAFSHLNIEAYPDPVPPFVQIVAQNKGQSAEEIERYITVPIETALSTAKHRTTMRSISLFGLSDVRVQFTYDVTYEEALQYVLNLLGQMDTLQNDTRPEISPWSPIGEIYRYRLVGPPNYSVMDIKTLQDWVLTRRFRAIPGVLDVSGWGGKTKTFEIQVDFNKLIAYGLTLPDVVETLNKSNVNVGGHTVDLGMQAAVVRGVGQIRTVDDVRNTMLTQVGGTPVRVGDIGEVIIGHQPRLGIAGQDKDDDIVQGIVLMRRGAQSAPTIERVKAEVELINNSNILPPGVKIERIYDRSELIGATTLTVMFNVLFGIVLVFFIQWLFLGDLRSAIIVSSAIPFAFCFAIGIMVLRGESANLLSIGALDFGLIIDATVIMVENIFRYLSRRAEEVAQLDDAPAGLGAKCAKILQAACEVNKPIFFSAMIIIVGFIPLFTLSGVEGHIFGPMAKSYAYALAGGLIATFTIAPAMSAFLLPDGIGHAETRIMSALRRLYLPILEFALRARGRTLVAAGGLLVLAVIASRSLGIEFLPHLEEGNLWIRATMPASVSLDAGNTAVNRMRDMLGRFPEVKTVVSQQGRTDDGLDSNGFFNAEFNIPLKPRSEWRSGVTKAALIDEVLGKLRAEFVGVEFNFSQYLQDNVQEAISGVKGENSLKLFGHDLATLTEAAEKIRTVMSKVPGIADLAANTVIGQPTVSIDVDRFAAGRYGLAPGDLNTAIRAAVGGEEAGNVYEPNSDRFFPIVVRLAPEFRQNIEAINNLTIGVKDSETSKVIQIPLKEVATVKLESGPLFIYREGQQRYLPIKFSVRGRDLGGAIYEAQRRIAEEVQLPPGYRIEWHGEFGHLQDAVKRLMVIVPITILLMTLLLYVQFSCVVDTLLSLTAIPMAAIGGIFALLVTGTPFSVSAAVGFVALFGISIMESIILLTYFNQLAEEGRERRAALVEACLVRLRPRLMTCLAAAVGLLPAAFSTAIGAQVQRPLALVVVGGMLFAPVLVLVVFPVLVDLFSRRARPQTSTETAPQAAG